MKVLGIIPARGGSKRVKGKNIKLLNGKPLIQYTLESAKESKLLTEFVVSSDDPKILEFVKTIGFEAPFTRPESLAKDNSGDKAVILHALDWYSRIQKNFDAVIYLRPTSPFRTVAMIDGIIEQLQLSSNDSIRSVTKVNGVHHPYWMFKTDENNNLTPLDSKFTIDKYYQSQLLPTVYRLNGAVDIIRTESIIENDSQIYGKNIGYFEIEEDASLDIDTEFDFKICEALMNLD